MEANSRTLLKLYKQYSRPVLEFGSVAICNASKTNLLYLQRVQNSAIRTALRATRWSRITDLNTAARMDPLTDRLRSLCCKSINRYGKSELIKSLDFQRILMSWHGRHRDQWYGQTGYPVSKHAPTKNMRTVAKKWFHPGVIENVARYPDAVKTASQSRRASGKRGAPPSSGTPVLWRGINGDKMGAWSDVLLCFRTWPTLSKEGES